MAVKIKLHPHIRSFIKTQGELEVEGRTVGECIAAVNDRFPGFGSKLLEENGNLRKGFKMFVNDMNTYPEDLNKEVHDGDTVTIITYITGG